MGVAFFPETQYVNPTADPTKDSFARLRVSNVETLFDGKQLVDNQPLVWDDQQISGTATSTYNQAKSCSTLAVNNLTAGRRVRQTFEKFAYQPGKSQYILMTAVVGNSSNGITKRLGYYDDNNGVFFQTVDGMPALGIRNGGVDTIIPQANWTFDTMDGQGHSHFTLDLTKCQIFSFDFEWLGAGSVRFGFVINGTFYIAHRADCANVLSAVYMQSPNLPLRYEIINSGTGPATSMDCICGTVMSEGGTQFSGIQRCADTGATSLAAGSNQNIYPLIAMRLKSSYIGNTAIAIQSISVACDATITYRWALLLNPTITGGSFSFSSSGTSSAVEYATPTSAITVTNEGTKFQSGYVAQGSAGAQTNVQVVGPPVRMGASIAGVADIVVLAVQRVSTSLSANYWGSISWEEQT